MAKSTKELLEERTQAAKEIDDLRKSAEGRAFSAEEKAKWDAANTRFDEADELIERNERAAKVAKILEEERDDPFGGDEGSPEQRGGDPKKRASDEDQALAMQAWCCRQMQRPNLITERHREAIERSGLNLDVGELEIRFQPMPMPLPGHELRRRAIRSAMGGERRDMVSWQQSAGGILIPDSFMSSFELAMMDNGGVMNAAYVWRTSTGEKVRWPTANDTMNEGILVGEPAPAETTSTDPATSAVEFGARKISSRLVLISHELLRDTPFNLVSFLGQVMGERIGRRANRMFTTGSGAGLECQGIVNAADPVITAASATAITLDEILELEDTVDPSYLRNASYSAHQRQWGRVRRLKAGDGSYLWQPSLTVGRPSTFNGYPANRNSAMASTMASGTRSMLFGDHSKFKIREVGGIRMKRLVERYADQDMEGFIAFYECDGALVDAGMKPLKCIVH